MKHTSACRAAARLGAAILVMGLMSCGEPEPATAPSLARGDGGKGPTVKSTSPSSGARNTTLTVRVLGSGYGPGSRAVWALDGDTTFAVSRVRTNSTTYVNPTELLADITIEADAPLELFDVLVVTAGGKKGIGIELFEVTAQFVLLPDLGGSSSAWAINSTGVIVGGSGDGSGASLAVRWIRAGGGWAVAALPGVNGSAYAINDAGTIAGVTHTTDANGVIQVRAAVWSTAGVLLDLGPGIVWGINAGETVVGQIDGPSGRRPVVWTKLSPSGWSPPQELPGLGGSGFGGTTGSAMAINDANVIAGDAWDASGIERAVTWKLEQGQWIGPTLVDPAPWGWVWSLNERGDRAGGVCVGSSTPTNCSLFGAAYWPVGGPAQVLPSLGGSSAANGVNELGEVVGRAFTPFRRGRQPVQLPVLWVGGTIRKLPLLGGVPEGEALAINDNGEVAGNTWSASGEQKAAVWLLRP